MTAIQQRDGDLDAAGRGPANISSTAMRTHDSLPAADGEALVFYDVTRLVAMRLSPIATGIDRVDIRFAGAVIDAYGDRCFPVVKVGNKAIMANRSLVCSLVDGLAKTWFDGRPCDLRTARALEAAGLTATIDGPLARRPRTKFFRHGGPAWSAFSPTATMLLNGLYRAALFVWTRARNAMHPNAGTEILRLLRSGGQGVYVVCSHRGIALCPELVSRLATTCGLRTLAYIHDLIPLEYPEYTRPGKTEIFARFLSELADAGAAFVANSRDTARRLETYARHRDWRIGEVSVIYPGVDAAPRGSTGSPAKPADHRGAPYFVVVGTIEPRKNHLLLLQIWRDLVRAGADPMPHLHIVGKRGWECENVVDLLDRCSAIRPFVTEHCGMCDDALRQLMRGARAILFPSFAEGFGLPLVEALHLGTPVIASDLPVFREVAGDTPMYLDPLDGMGWRDAIMGFLDQRRHEGIASFRSIGFRANWPTRAIEIVDVLNHRMGI